MLISRVIVLIPANMNYAQRAVGGWQVRESWRARDGDRGRRVCRFWGRWLCVHETTLVGCMYGDSGENGKVTGLG